MNSPYYTLDATEAAAADEAAEALVLAFTATHTPEAPADDLTPAELASMLGQADAEAWTLPSWL